MTAALEAFIREHESTAASWTELSRTIVCG